MNSLQQTASIISINVHYIRPLWRMARCSQEISMSIYLSNGVWSRGPGHRHSINEKYFLQSFSLLRSKAMELLEPVLMDCVMIHESRHVSENVISCDYLHRRTAKFDRIAPCSFQKVNSRLGKQDHF
jgi:hypothetical protein